MFKWSGDSTEGFDPIPNNFNPQFTYDNDNGNVRLKYEHSSASLIQIGSFGGTESSTWRICWEFTDLPTSSKAILEPFTITGTRCWRFLLTAGGDLVFHDANGAWRGAFYGVPLNQEVRMEIIATDTRFQAKLFDSPTSMVEIGDIDTTAGEYGLVDNIRIGATSGSPLVPTCYLDDIRVEANSFDWPGPRVDVRLTGPTYAIIGDSNTQMGSDNYSPLYQSLTAKGIPTDNVFVYGVPSKRMIPADIIGRTTAENILDAKNGFDGIDHWLIALGGNNSSDSETSIASDINNILSLIGAGQRITWLGLSNRGTITSDRNKVNQVLQSTIQGKDNITYADWDSYIRAIDGGDENSPLWPPDDNIHMTPLGYEVRANYFADILKDVEHPQQGWDAMAVGTNQVSEVRMGEQLLWKATQ